MTAPTMPDLGLDRYVPSIATEWDEVAHGQGWQVVDATLCFVDISGFTHLSERLARRGRIGAEELTDVLNHVFGKMLEVAYLYGGSLLKFGGDALLLLFPADDHALRGTSAAVEMRRVLKEAEGYETSVGKLRLRMSVGVHSGPIHLFKAGQSHEELVIAGPGATATTAMEKTANAGEIVISGGTREALPEGSAPAQKEDGWILTWRKPRCSPVAEVVRPTTDADVVTRWVPTALRDFLGAAVPEPEHRIANVGFIRFCGVDDLLASEGSDAVSRSLDEVITVIQGASDEEGVTFLATDINEDGGKVILVTGAPRAQEQDESRLLRTVRRIADTPTTLHMHFGVNQGHVFTGAIGTDYRATYTIIGDTVNLSARLAAAAPANTIYATTGVLDNSSVLFSSKAVEPFYVKGKDDPVHAYSVGEQIGEREVDTEGELPFVGRRQELNLVTEAIFGTADGTGTVLTIVGDVGSGKSRLVREACVICSDVRAVSIRSESYGASSPYRPLRDVFRSLLEVERGDPAAMAKTLAAKVSAIDRELLPYLPFIGDVTHIEVAPTDTVDAIEPRFRQDRLADAVIRLLEGILTTPTVFDLEDAQWMDDASAHLMNRIAAETDHHPWTVLVSRRAGEEGFAPDDGRVLELGGLEPDEAEALVIEVTAAAPLRPHEIEAIVSRAGGNPLFLEEILRVVRETGSVEQLPDSLGSVVSTGIDALPPLTRNILRYASVLGRSFRTVILQEILAEDDLELDAATRRSLRRFLVADGDGRLRFANGMVRDVAYDGLSFKRRQELHLRAAEAMEANLEDPESAADLLALHYSIGHEPEKAWHYGRIAGDRAREAYSNVEAAAHYARALESARGLDKVTDLDRAAVWTDLGDVREHAGLFDASVEAYRRAYRLVGNDRIAQAKLLLKRAFARESAARYVTALRETTEAKRILDGVESDEAARVAAQATAFYAMVRQRQERPHDALRTANVAAKQAASAEAKDALARAYSVIAWASLMLDDPGAETLSRQALEMYEVIDDLVGQNKMHNNLGVLAYFSGRWDEALQHYERSKSGAERLGNIVDAGIAAANIGEVLLNQNRFEEAESELAEASRVARASGNIFTAIFSELQLGRLLVEQGELDQGIETLQTVREEAVSVDLAGSAHEASLYVADALIRKGEPDAAIDLLDEAAAAAGAEAGIYEAIEARLRANAFVGKGETQRAIYELDRGLAFARARDMEYDEALLLTIKAGLLEAEDPVEADRLTRNAQALYKRLGVRAVSVPV